MTSNCIHNLGDDLKPCSRISPLRANILGKNNNEYHGTERNSTVIFTYRKSINGVEGGLRIRVDFSIESNSPQVVLL